MVSCALQLTTAESGLPMYLPLRPRYLARGIVGYAHLVEQRFDIDLVHLHAQLPRVVAQHQPGHLLVGQHRNAAAVLAVGRALHLGDGILPLVEEHGAAGAVGHDEVGLVGRHAFELLMRIGDRVAAVGLHQVVAEPETAAVAPLGVIDALAAPRLDHAGQHVGELRAADARLGEDLGIVAADVLHHAGAARPSGRSTSRKRAFAAISPRWWNTTSEVWARLAGLCSSRPVAL